MVDGADFDAMSVGVTLVQVGVFALSRGSTLTVPTTPSSLAKNSFRVEL
jgi:hypothetical protein